MQKSRMFEEKVPPESWIGSCNMMFEQEQVKSPFDIKEPMMQVMSSVVMKEKLLLRMEEFRQAKTDLSAMDL